MRKPHVAGGNPGAPGDIWMNPETDKAKRLPTCYPVFPLKEGDVFQLDTAAGGGYGDPPSRPPEHVLADVREGHLSAEAAERDYGAVLMADGDAVDETATEKKHKKL